jgi:hypothetical protein
MTPPRDHPSIADAPAPVAEVRPIRPPTVEGAHKRLDDVERSVGLLAEDGATEARVTKDVQEALGTILTTARAAKSEASQARAIAARVETAIEEMADELHETRDEQGELSLAVVDTQLAIGKPPDPEALARASSVDLSPAEVAKLDKAAKLGTGLHRRVSEIEIRVSRKAALAAVVGTLVPQAVIHLPDIIAAIARLAGG